MARLFVTPREIDFINDLSKEIMKDVIGDRIYLYSVSWIKSNVHEIYEESPEKVFEHPVIVDAIVSFMPNEVKSTEFGTESYFNVELYVQQRDLLDKGIQIKEGDFFSYGDRFFEITSLIFENTIYGQIEYNQGIKVVGREARKSLFTSKIFGPTSEKYSDGARETFTQQRGLPNNAEGPTGDVRSMMKNGVLDEPLSGPSRVVVNPSGSTPRSSFYDEQ